MGLDDWGKAPGRADPGFARALDEHVRRQVAALAAGRPVSAALAQTVFGRIAWPVALGRPPGHLADGFSVECRYDVWEPYVAGGEERWEHRFERCPVRVVEGASDAAAWRVEFVASAVPDNRDPPHPLRPLLTRLAVMVRNSGKWTVPGGAAAGSRIVVPGALGFLKRPGAMLFEFEVVAGPGGRGEN